MTEPAEYTPPKVWVWNKPSGGQFANINRPIAGATHEKELPVGSHPLQLYSLGTPNGVKVTIMLEELLALGHNGRRIRRLADPDRRGRPVRQRLRRGQSELQDPGADGPQRAEADPRVRIRRDPACTSPRSSAPSCRPSRAARAECLSWLFWQMGSAPYLGGGFGHFYAYAPTKIEYAIDRFAMEVKRQLDVLDRRLAESEYVAGDDYTIADMAIWPWYGGLVKGWQYGAGEFLQRAGVQERAALGRRDLRAAGGAARPHGQPHLRRAVEPVARAPRRQRLRDEDAGQARAGELNGALTSPREADINGRTLRASCPFGYGSQVEEADVTGALPPPGRGGRPLASL